MATDSTLEQRVEALEQLSHSRVVERVGSLEQRVARMESARETEEPHLATRADIVRLETMIEAQSEQLNQRIDAQTEQINQRIDAQSEFFLGKLDAQSEQTRTMFDAQTELFQGKLDAQAGQFLGKLGAQTEQINQRMDAQTELFQGKLDAQSKDLGQQMEQRINRQTLWFIGTAIALAALILSRLPG